MADCTKAHQFAKSKSDYRAGKLKQWPLQLMKFLQSLQNCYLITSLLLLYYRIMMRFDGKVARTFNPGSAWACLSNN